MGYTTDFDGALTLTPGASPEQLAYINAFAKTRRMKRDATKTELLSDPIREAVNLPVGEDGGYYVGGFGENLGQNETADVLDSNQPPGQPLRSRTVGGDFMEWFDKQRSAEKDAVANGAQPGLWCQWVLTNNGSRLEWDGGEKFYSYVEWLQYLITNFFQPWGIELNGEIGWRGEDRSDIGTIAVQRNLVTAAPGELPMQRAA